MRRPTTPSFPSRFAPLPVRMLDRAVRLDGRIAGVCAAIGATALMLVLVPALAMAFAGGRP